LLAEDHINDNGFYDFFVADTINEFKRKSLSFMERSLRSDKLKKYGRRHWVGEI